MLSILKNKNFWKFFIIGVLTLSFVGATTIFILNKLGVFEIAEIDQKYIYYLDQPGSNPNKPIMVTEGIERALEVRNYYKGDRNIIFGGDDMRYVKSFVKVKVLEYNEDSTLAKIYAKYEAGIAPRVKIRYGYVPAFTLHNSLPDTIDILD